PGAVLLCQALVTLFGVVIRLIRVESLDLDRQRIKRFGREEEEVDFLAVLDGAYRRYGVPHKNCPSHHGCSLAHTEGHLTFISGPITATHFGVELIVGKPYANSQAPHRFIPQFDRNIVLRWPR